MRHSIQGIPSTRRMAWVTWRTCACPRRDCVSRHGGVHMTRAPPGAWPVEETGARCGGGGVAARADQLTRRRHKHTSRGAPAPNAPPPPPSAPAPCFVNRPQRADTSPGKTSNRDGGSNDDGHRSHAVARVGSKERGNPPTADFGTGAQAARSEGRDERVAAAAREPKAPSALSNALAAASAPCGGVCRCERKPSGRRSARPHPTCRRQQQGGRWRRVPPPWPVRCFAGRHPPCWRHSPPRRPA